MNMISLGKYGPIISDKAIGEEIYHLISSELADKGNVGIDLNEIKSMATFCAKQIFGRLYKELGPEEFYKKIMISNANSDVKLIIRIGIQNALGDA